MRVLITGGTGYLGQAIVRALVARGHDPVVFARHASQRTSPWRRRRRRRPRSRRRCSPRRAIATRCATGAALVEHLAQGSGASSTRSTSADSKTPSPPCATLGRRALVYTSSFLALPPAGEHDADPRERLSANQGRGRCASRNAPPTTARPIVSMYPGVIYGPGVRIGRQPARPPARRTTLRGKLPGLVGADRIWCFSWVEDVADAHVAALERGTIGAALHARRRKRAADASVRDRVRAQEVAAPAQRFRTGSPRRSAPSKSSAPGARARRRRSSPGARSTSSASTGPSTRRPPIRDLGYSPSALTATVTGAARRDSGALASPRALDLGSQVDGTSPT